MARAKQYNEQEVIEKDVFVLCEQKESTSVVCWEGNGH
jgi:hypothetical protein